MGPDAALARNRIQPETQPGPPEGMIRKRWAEGKREHVNHFRASRHRAPPGGVSESEDGGDQRTRVAQSDPEDEISYVESPEDWRAKARNAQSGIDLPAKCRQRRNHGSREERKSE